jgi:hypothetical protein
MSDGWQFITKKSVINVILGVDGILNLRLSQIALVGRSKGFSPWSESSIPIRWDDDFFEKVFTQVWQCIQTVSTHQKFLVRFRVIVESLPANEQIPGGTESDRIINTKIIYENLNWWLTENICHGWTDMPLRPRRRWDCEFAMSFLSFNSKMDIYQYILHVKSPSLCLCYIYRHRGTQV